MKKLKIVGVMGSGQQGYEDLSLSLGKGLARLGVHLHSGGGGAAQGVAQAESLELIKQFLRRCYDGLQQGYRTDFRCPRTKPRWQRL